MGTYIRSTYTVEQLNLALGMVQDEVKHSPYSTILLEGYSATEIDWENNFVWPGFNNTTAYQSILNLFANLM